MKGRSLNIISPKKSFVGTNGTIWNLPNYDGELFTASPEETRFLSLIGGLNGGKQTANFEFPTGSLYTITSRTQPAITENQSITGATPAIYSRSQEKNVSQIFQEAVVLSYEKLSNTGRLSGLNTQGAINNAADELAFQQMVALKKIAGDVNYSFINGEYQISTTADVANKTRGLLEAIVAGGSTIDALGAAISVPLIKQLLRTMFVAGARFTNPVMLMNAYQLQAVSSLFAYAPMDRNVGGFQLKQLVMDIAGNVAPVLEADMPTGTIAIADIAYCAPVFQPVPTKGNLFYEAKPQAGAAEGGQIYGKLGLDYGPMFVHGSITNLAIA